MINFKLVDCFGVKISFKIEDSETLQSGLDLRALQVSTDIVLPRQYNFIPT